VVVGCTILKADLACAPPVFTINGMGRSPPFAPFGEQVLLGNLIHRHGRVPSIHVGCTLLVDPMVYPQDLDISTVPDGAPL